MKLGKDFNKLASQLMAKAQGHPLRYIEQNIDIIFTRFLKPAEISHEFPDNFEFYMFTEKLAQPVFDGIKIGVDFRDEQEVFSYVGFSHDVEAWYTDVLHPYLRMHYNDSPVAMFEIRETDNKTFVGYDVITNAVASEREEAGTTEEIGTVETEKAPTGEKAEVDKALELEKEKNRGIEKSLELEKERTKAIEKSIELENLRIQSTREKLAAIQKLFDMGFSKDEIKDMLK